MVNKCYLINFDKPLPDTVIEQLKSKHNDIEELVVIDKKVIIHFNRQIYIQCVDIRAQIEKDYPDIFSGKFPIIVNLPGLAIAAVYLMNELEAASGTKPKILELIKLKGVDNLFSNFEFRRVLNLEYNKNVSRNYIKEKNEHQRREEEEEEEEN